MATFPVNTDDPEGLVDAVNYLLSGPAGLGQNFAGFSAYTPAWLTGNFRLPYSVNTPADLYVPPIYLQKSEMLDGYTWKYTFIDEQPTPPFQVGNNIFVGGVENSFYDGTFIPIGVIDCTTTYVIARTQSQYTVVPPSPGGFVVLEAFRDDYISTDCNSRVVVNSATDRVFISAQVDAIISYQIMESVPSDTLTVEVAVDRYIGGLDTDTVTGNSDYRFSLDKTVAAKTYTYTRLASGTGTLPLQETVFATVLDQPAPGYYWYILEMKFSWTNGNSLLFSERSQIESVKTLLRCMTTQVVKQ
jgi:hypothetical protein